jgi:hypothetical protein
VEHGRTHGVWLDKRFGRNEIVTETNRFRTTGMLVFIIGFASTALRLRLRPLSNHPPNSCKVIIKFNGLVDEFLCP